MALRTARESLPPSWSGPYLAQYDLRPGPIVARAEEFLSARDPAVVRLGEFLPDDASGTGWELDQIGSALRGAGMALEPDIRTGAGRDAVAALFREPFPSAPRSLGPEARCAATLLARVLGSTEEVCGELFHWLPVGFAAGVPAEQMPRGEAGLVLRVHDGRGCRIPARLGEGWRRRIGAVLIGQADLAAPGGIAALLAVLGQLGWGRDEGLRAVGARLCGVPAGGEATALDRGGVERLEDETRRVARLLAPTFASGPGGRAMYRASPSGLGDVTGGGVGRPALVGP